MNESVCYKTAMILLDDIMAAIIFQKTINLLCQGQCGKCLQLPQCQFLAIFFLFFFTPEPSLAMIQISGLASQCARGILVRFAFRSKAVSPSCGTSRGFSHLAAHGRRDAVPLTRVLLMLPARTLDARTFGFDRAVTLYGGDGGKRQAWTVVSRVATLLSYSAIKAIDTQYLPHALAQRPR